jgi:hypothetical protein
LREFLSAAIALDAPIACDRRAVSSMAVCNLAQSWVATYGRAQPSATAQGL